MEFKSEQKHIIISPRKVRPVADVIKKMSPVKALEQIGFIKRGASYHLYKVVKSAISNAVQKGVDPLTLVFKEIQVGEGPRLKRGMPVSRGRWHAIKKRMSHIKVILATKKVTAQNLETKSKKSESKKQDNVKPVKSSKKGVKQNLVSAK